MKVAVSPDDVDLSDVRFPMWTAYNRPADFPHVDVLVRLFDASIPQPTDVVLAFPDFAACMGTFCRWHFIVRSPGDDPKIIGTFI